MNLTIDVLDRIIAREKARLSGLHGEGQDRDADGGEEQQPETQPTKPEPAGRQEFVHLHNHTDYSMLDGMCRIEDLVKRAKEMGMPAVAMTDHGNLHGAIQFHKASRNAGITPILGCEIYVSDPGNSKKRHHLVLLAKDLTGWKNIMRISTAGYADGHQKSPQVELDFIGQHAGGLVAMTACISGSVPSLILSGQTDQARTELARLKDIFREDLYVELQDHGLPEQKMVNPELIALAEELDVPIVASNDVHYVNSDDFPAHEVLKQISSEDDDSGRAGRGFGSDQFYFKTADEMAALFPEEYLARTLEVAEKCSLELDLSTSHLPEFTPPDGLTPEEYLWQRIQEGVQTRYGGQIDEARRKRSKHEFGIIRQTGFCGYFLIIDDMVRYARRRGIRIGPGRGSCVASLISFVLGITGVDPMDHNLLFERFLTPERVTPPDIDIDFQHDRRHELVEYMGGKYGYASLIASFNRLLPRSLVRQVGKVFGIDPSVANIFLKSGDLYPILLGFSL